MFLTKMALFWPNNKKKDWLDDVLSGTVHLLHHWFRPKAARMAFFSRYTNDGLTSDYTLVWFFMADWHHSCLDAAPKWPTQPAFLQQLFQAIMETLSQKLGFFRVESKAKILHH